jgi:hypothetical protein
MSIHRLGCKVVLSTGCSACGKDAGCNCGVIVVSKSERIAAYDAAYPNQSTRKVAEAIGGVSHMAVSWARKNSGVTGVTPEDDRPTIDNPPKGPALFADQDDPTN